MIVAVYRTIKSNFCNLSLEDRTPAVVLLTNDLHVN